MPPAVIENPILNSPYEEPRRHFRFLDDGITDEVVEERRLSAYFVPVPQPKKKGKQLRVETEWTKERIRENQFINRVRDRVARFRESGHHGVTATTRRLLEHWTDADRERPFFFCQLEAVETAIYLTEVARKEGDAWIENSLREANDTANPGLYRLACKMATGSGKTLVMSMLIAWQALNKLANRRDKRFSATFLIIAPGIPIRDRLRVLLPSDPENYYRQWQIAPPELADRLAQAKVEVINFHRLMRREGGDAARLTKSILTRGGESPFKESWGQMVRRVCRDFGTRKNVVVINDEAHHCYHRKPEDDPEAVKEKLDVDERREAKGRERDARVWIRGLEAIERKLGIRAVYDLSATPFFLKGSGYKEGTLFPWVVSDFSLIDAIESGLVKVPRVPIADDAVTGELPMYRDIWPRVRDRLPRKGRGKQALGEKREPPRELEGALRSLYGNYEAYYSRWEKNTEARTRGLTPPVFIVVCNNTSVSKLVYDWIGGWEKELPDGSTRIVPGQLSLFDNSKDGAWLARPNTTLIDSEQLESGEALKPAFKKLMGREIGEWKDEYRKRFPGRDPDALTDEDLLREVMNTVGKAGKLGEQVRCVVSVSMLTEGWDANTVTHILGVRAFGTQLLCEQVVGRGLRRRSYSLNEKGRFDPEYAEVYGVPFSFIPASGTSPDPTPGPEPTHVRALEERADCEIRFPILDGYRYEIARERLDARFDEESRLKLTTADVATLTENAPIVGKTTLHELPLKERREGEVDFLLAKLVLEKYFRLDGGERPERDAEHELEGDVQAWLFPQILEIARRWRAECLELGDDTYPQLLLLVELAHDAADRIHRSIAKADGGSDRLLPLIRPHNSEGSTRHVAFDTTKDVYSTAPEKSHVSHVVLDSNWEAKLAQGLESMDEVVAYVKNQGLGFTIPYSLNGHQRNYVPDYIVRIDDAAGDDEPLNLVIEVTGEKKKEKAAKVDTAANLWVPAVNHHGGLGRWAFLEITDPWKAKGTIREFLEGRAP